MTDFIVVLVEPMIQGNIGAVARTMMNFCVRELRLVGDISIQKEARQRAVHAQVVLDNAGFYPTLADAVKDVNLRAATTGVAPENEKRHLRSHLELEEFAERSVRMEEKIALIFGRENYGLFNSELRLCDVVVTIPTSGEYPIMNLSHAASVVLYQLYIARQKTEGRFSARRDAAPGDMDRLCRRVDSLLMGIRYPEHKSENTSIMLRRILGRAFISRWEYHTLMGVLSHVERGLQARKEREFSEQL
ncbi:MAG: RNA methyltransferase [Thermoplasmata archaeon]|nr:RNA methyltransferase [Thermoplasmata archaeon]